MTVSDCPALDISNLAHRYGSFQALESISFCVPRGTIFGLLGLNGAGKTTTIECALGLLRVQQGHCRVLDVDSREIHKTWGRFSVVFDSAHVYGHLSARQNLQLAWRLVGRTGRSPEDALRLVGLEHAGRRPARKLSLGMARRLSIARGLLGQPEFVVMDEPLSGLDAEGVDTILDLIRQLHREENTTFLLSSHRLHELETLCDHVGLIHEGRVVAHGPLQDILASGKRTVHVEATPSETLDSFLDQCPQVISWSRPKGAAHPEDVIVELGDSDSAQFNASLHGAGFAVSRLSPQGMSLPQFFREKTGHRNG